MKAITKKLLVASVAVGVLSPLIDGQNIVCAASISVVPRNASDNETEISSDSYSINDELVSIGEDDYYEYVFGGLDSDTWEQDIFNNFLVISGGSDYIDIYGDIFGGYGYSKVYSNSVDIFSSLNSYEGSRIVGGYSDSDGDVYSNSLNILPDEEGSSIYISRYAIGGGYSKSGNVYDNNLNLGIEDADSESFDVYARYIGGGYSEGGNVTNNTLNIYGGMIEADLLGGGGSRSDSGSATENKLNIYGGTVDFTYMFGGVSLSQNATDNTVKIDDGEINGKALGGGVGFETAYNTLEITNGTVDVTYIGGGVSYGGTSTGNTVNIEGGNITSNVVGGGGNIGVSIDESLSNINVNGSGTSNVTNNTLNISGGTIESYLVAGGVGETSTATVTNNKLNITGGSVTGQYIVGGAGGYDVTSTDLSVSENEVNISGGTITGNIFAGGYIGSGSVTDNVINISESPDLTSAWLYGYGEGSEDSGSVTHSGNTLNIYSKNLTAQNISNFDVINFYLPESTVNGDTILALTQSSTDISGAVVNAGVSGNANLSAGDTITLLTNAGTITTDGTTYGKLTEGVSLEYDLTVSKVGNSIVASLGNATSTTSESLPVSTGVTGVALIGNSMDMPNVPQETIELGDISGETVEVSEVTENETSVDENPTESSNVQTVEPKGYEIFANMGGGSLRTKAGNGSYVDMTSRSINLGFARSLEASSGKFTIAPIIDYAHGNYDSYLADGTHGSGTTKYIAGGLIARRILQNGFYYETSARVGKVKTDFSSSDLDKNLNQNVSYNTSATTLSGHLKLGKMFRLNKNNLLDVYGTYYHAHQGSMDATLSTGDHYNFSSADSGRFRIGYRLTTRTSKISKIYTGLAYQYEDASGITATFKEYETPSAGESGASGMLELGWVVKPFKNSVWGVDLNTTGWVGHQRGVTAFAKIQKAF